METMSLITGLMMWLVPPTMFVLTGLGIVYFTGKSTSLFHENFHDGKIPDYSGYLAVAGLVFPALALAYFHLVLGYGISLGGSVGYIVFEWCGSWVVYGIFTVSGLHSWFQCKEKHLHQKFYFNLDFDNIDVGQHVVLLTSENYKENPYRMELRQCCLEYDFTGSYKILFHVENWYSDEYWTEDQIKEKLKGHFKTKNTYLVDNNVNIIHNETKTPKVIVID